MGYEFLELYPVNPSQLASFRETFKWIRILFCCWKNRAPYDPRRYLPALQTRGSVYAEVAT